MYSVAELSLGITNRFCRARNVDPIQVLNKCDPALFKLYLVWRIRNARIQKESTIITYWKALSLLYSQRTARWMKEDVLYDVRNVSWFLRLAHSRSHSRSYPK